jgi:hypothetical protein
MANCTHQPVLLDDSDPYSYYYTKKCSLVVGDSNVTNEMLEILHLEDGGEFDGIGRHAIAGYVADPYGDNDTNKDETPFIKFRAWVLHLCFLWLYHYLRVGNQTLVIAKTDIIAICEHLSNDILPAGREATLDINNRVMIASRIYDLVRGLLKIRAADFFEMRINKVVGRTF